MRYEKMMQCLLICLLFNSCNQNIEINNNPHGIKYTITKQDALPYEQSTYYSMGEIEHTKDGCIKFLDFDYGNKNYTTLCGQFSIEHY